MKISILTLFPKMIASFFEESIIKRAIEKKLVEIEIINLRDFATDKYKTVDDRPYGGGAGMVLRADILQKELSHISNIKDKKLKIILTSAKGKKFNQELANRYSQLNHLIILAGHYEGVDERIMDYVDEEISLGDFVMTGGEITVAAIVDSVVRLIPNVLKKNNATTEESFFTVPLIQLLKLFDNHPVLMKLQKKGINQIQLLEYPHFTRPEEFNKKKVPAVLLSGNHQEIQNWRLKQAFEITLKKRPDLL